MLSDKIFKIALLVSLTGHSLFFYRWPGPARIFPDKKPINPLEISYYVLEQPPIVSKPAIDIEKKEESAKNESSVTKVTINEKQTAIVPLPESLKASEEKSLYLDYYQSIREKIRRVANYNYYDYSKIGEIYLSFILESKGNLKNIELFEYKSSLDRKLKKIALNSVKQASPFPPFPPGLNQKQLSFKVIISFEREN